MNRKAIRDLVDRHALTEGITETPLEGVQLYRVSTPIDRIPTVYPPSLCVIVQGSKRVYLNGSMYVYDDSQYLCATMPMPVEAELPRATPDEPVLGLLISLETRVMTETLVEYEPSAGQMRASRDAEPTPGLAEVDWDEDFASALERMLALLGDPTALRVLGLGRLRELLFLVIQGGAGPLIRRTVGASHDLSRALAYLHANLGESLSVDDLARRAGMSRPVFDRRFRAATTFSPLQFIKALRLNQAAMQIARGINIGQAAFDVGYTSASQFSREFRRQYGKTPRQWGKLAAGSVPDPQATTV